MDFNQRDTKLIYYYLCAILKHPIPLPHPTRDDNAAVTIITMTQLELHNIVKRIRSELKIDD